MGCVNCKHPSLLLERQPDNQDAWGDWPNRSSTVVSSRFSVRKRQQKEGKKTFKIWQWCSIISWKHTNIDVAAQYTHWVKKKKTFSVPVFFHFCLYLLFLLSCHISKSPPEGLLRTVRRNDLNSTNIDVNLADDLMTASLIHVILSWR